MDGLTACKELLDMDWWRRARLERELRDHARAPQGVVADANSEPKEQAMPSRPDGVDRTRPVRGRGAATWVFRALALGCAIWASVAFGLEVRRAVTKPVFPNTPPSLWRFDGPHVEALRSALEPVDRRVPRGSVVVVEAVGLASSELFFLTMWCSYFLPHHDVVRPHVETRGPRYVWSYPEATLRLDLASSEGAADDAPDSVVLWATDPLVP